MPREYHRKLRVGSELQRVLNSLLYSSVKDPRLEGIRVTAVDLSNDLGVARVFFSTLDLDGDPAPAEVALLKAAGFLRTRAGELLRMRRVPELRFLHDDSAKQGLKLTKLIEDVAPKESLDISAEKH